MVYGITNASPIFHPFSVCALSGEIYWSLVVQIDRIIYDKRALM